MKKSIILAWLSWLVFWCFAYWADSFSTEFKDAYWYAYTNWITSAKSIDDADMNWGLTRIAMAKMMSNYAMNLLWLEADKSRNCSFKDVSTELDTKYGNWVTLACQLWLMWISDDGSVSKNFNPYGVVTRGQWATVFSRALSKANWEPVEEWTPYYEPHMSYLKSKWIIKSTTNPSYASDERRWNAMLMLKRSAASIKPEEQEAVKIEDKEWIDDTVKWFRWVILNWADLRPDTAKDSDSVNVKEGHWGYTIITVALTGSTLYVDYDYNFVLKISWDGVNVKEFEVTYDDFWKMTWFEIDWTQLFYSRIFTWEDYLAQCSDSNKYGFNDYETNRQIWGGNEKYIFIIGKVYKNKGTWMKILTNTSSLKDLVARKHCDCKSCKVDL